MKEKRDYAPQRTLQQSVRERVRAEVRALATKYVEDYLASQRRDIGR